MSESFRKFLARIIYPEIFYYRLNDGEIINRQVTMLGDLRKRVADLRGIPLDVFEEEYTRELEKKKWV